MTEEKKDILESIKEVNENNFVEEMLKKNYFDFEHQGSKYRVRKPSLRMRNEANEKRVEKYNELLKDSRYKFEDDLKKEYLTKGVNIDEIQSRMLSLETKKATFQMRLGEELKKENPSQPTLDTYKEEIESIQNSIVELSIKKASLLEFSIENQIMIFSYSYLTYLILQKQVIKKKEDGTEEEVYQRAFDNYDEYLDSEESLINKAAFYSTFVLRQNE